MNCPAETEDLVCQAEEGHDGPHWGIVLSDRWEVVEFVLGTGEIEQGKG